MFRRRLTGLFLAFLFFVMQGVWSVHLLEHELGADGDGEARCEFCFAMHGMGATLPGTASAAVVIPDPDRLPPGEYAARADADPVHPHQQGPPHLENLRFR
jgi:hypothetical protein